MAKQVNGEYEYKLLYSGQLSPVARLNANDEIVEQYVYGTRVNVPDYMVKNGRKYRILTDHKGSVRMVVDTHNWEIVQQTEYSPFGMIIDEQLAEGWEPVIFGYAGGLQDRDTGLVRFGARNYDPEVGRWTSKEPLGFNGASNFYVYAGNDPVNYVDINGLFRYAPNVPKVIENHINTIPFSDHELAFYSTLFNVSKDQVMEAFKPGKGPCIVMDDLDDEDANANYEDNVIRINNASWNRAVAAGAPILFVETMIGHELAHHFDKMDGQDIINKRYPDAGHIWEIKARGHIMRFKKDGVITPDFYYNKYIDKYLVEKGIIK